MRRVRKRAPVREYKIRKYTSYSSILAQITSVAAVPRLAAPCRALPRRSSNGKRSTDFVKYEAGRGGAAISYRYYR